LTDDERPRTIERARAGDWEAIEDLVGGAIAPTFDAAIHLFGDEAQARRVTEEALLAMLVSVRRGELRDGDPLTMTARSLAASASAAGAHPFPAGLEADDLVAIGCRPDDARGAALGTLPPADRVAAILAFALDLGAHEIAPAIGREVAAVERAIQSALAAIPHAQPEQALRDLLDARAGRFRLPAEIEEHVLDRFEAQG
jgi:hypothetical protein